MGEQPGGVALASQQAVLPTQLGIDLQHQVATVLLPLAGVRWETVICSEHILEVIEAVASACCKRLVAFKTSGNRIQKLYSLGALQPGCGLPESTPSTALHNKSDEAIRISMANMWPSSVTQLKAELKSRLLLPISKCLHGSNTDTNTPAVVLRRKPLLCHSHC